jgi:Transposase DDE domain
LIAILALHQRDYGPEHKIPDSPAKTDAYVVSRRERKKVEMLFAHLKRILKLDRLRLRGPSGAKDEFLLAATAQNLRKLAKRIPLPAPIFAA